MDFFAFNTLKNVSIKNIGNRSIYPLIHSPPSPFRVNLLIPLKAKPCRSISASALYIKIQNIQQDSQLYI